MEEPLAEVPEVQKLYRAKFVEEQAAAVKAYLAEPAWWKLGAFGAARHKAQRLTIALSTSADDNVEPL